MPLMKALLTDATASTELSADMFSGIVEAFTTNIPVTLIVGVIGVVIGAGVAYVFTWWGARKVSSGLTKSFLKGKISI